MLKEWKRDCIIHDKGGNKFWIEMEVTYRNGYPEFSIHNQSGQGQDNINPRTPNQKELLIIWHTWHLNGTHAGTEEQERALASWPNPPTTRSYEGNAQYLKDIGMYEVMYQGQPYKYGNGWIRKDLPTDFIERMNKLCEALDEEEDEYGSVKITEEFITDDRFVEKAEELDTTPAKLMAICIHCEVSMEGFDNIEKDYGDNRFTVEGEDYLVCDEAEADDEWDKSLESYIDDCILPELNEQYRQYFDNEKWKDDAKNDGRGHSLSSYDGNENEVTVEGETFYLYRN